MLNRGVPATQQLLFPDPRPLVERLGRDFFRRLPECPGVYLMRDESDACQADFLGAAGGAGSRQLRGFGFGPGALPSS